MKAVGTWGKKGSIRGGFFLESYPWVPHGTQTEVSADHPVTLMCTKHRSVQVLDQSPKQFRCMSVAQGWSNATLPVSKASVLKYCVALNCFSLWMNSSSSNTDTFAL